MITCPRCKKVSHHPEDEAQGYCGFCHWWTSDPQLGAPEVIAQAEAEGAIPPLKGTYPTQIPVEDHTPGSMGTIAKLRRRLLGQ